MSNVIDGGFGGDIEFSTDPTASETLEGWAEFLDGLDVDVALVMVPKDGGILLASNVTNSDTVVSLLDMGKYQMMTAFFEGEPAHLIGPPKEEEYDGTTH